MSLDIQLNNLREITKLGEPKPFNPLNERANKLKLVKQRIKLILSASSANGLPNIVNARNLFFRTMWLIFFIFSTLAGSYYTIDSVLNYLKFNVVTTIKVINEQQSPFPTISFCSHPKFNASIENIILSLRFEKDYETRYQAVFEEFIDTTYGKCFRYNSGKNILGQSIQIMNTTTTGLSNHLRMAFYLDMTEQTDFAELLLNIYNSSSPPLDLENDGFWLKPGSWNYFSVDRVFTEQQGQPYNDCLKDLNTFKMNKTIIDHIMYSKETYSQKNCNQLCSYLFALEESNCGCNSTLDNFKRDCSSGIYFGQEKNENISSCVAKYLKRFRRQKVELCFKYYCPLECDSMSFSINNYLEQFPVSGLIGTETRLDYNLTSFKTYEQINRHYIVLFVYYRKLEYTLISQEPKTETFDFISNIGGILGLFLGVSFLSFIEIFEIVLEIFFIFIIKK
jgi:hypothetical protein